MAVGDSHEIAARMGAASAEELTRICTVEAGDYSEIAVGAARAELARRGVDVSGLVPTPAKPAASSPARGGAILVILGLTGAVFSAPWITELPPWAAILIESGLGALVIVGALRMYGSRETAE